MTLTSFTTFLLTIIYVIKITLLFRFYILYLILHKSINVTHTDGEDWGEGEEDEDGQDSVILVEEGGEREGVRRVTLPPLLLLEMLCEGELFTIYIKEKEY